MTLVSNISDDIPGLVKAALIFNGATPGGKSASLAILTDGKDEALIDLAAGLNVKADGLTKAMRSYVSGLSQVGQVLKARKIEDEDGVTEDDLERAAILFAFPKVAQNGKALGILKSHLDALQEHGVLGKAGANPPKKEAAPEKEANQDDPADEIKDTAEDRIDDGASDDIAAKAEAPAEQKTFVGRAADAAEAAAPLALVGAAGAAAAVADDVEEASEEVVEEAEETLAEAAEEIEEVAADTMDEIVEEVVEAAAPAEEVQIDAVETPKADDAPPRPSPAQMAQARLNNGAARKPSFFGR